MSHKKLLQEGKINFAEYRELETLKRVGRIQNYEALEAEYAKRPVNFRRPFKTKMRPAFGTRKDGQAYPKGYMVSTKVPIKVRKAVLRELARKSGEVEGARATEKAFAEAEYQEEQEAEENKAFGDAVALKVAEDAMAKLDAGEEVDIKKDVQDALEKAGLPRDFDPEIPALAAAIARETAKKEATEEEIQRKAIQYATSIAKMEADEFAQFMKVVGKVKPREKYHLGESNYLKPVPAEFKCPGCQHFHKAGSTCAICGHRRD